MRPEPDHPVERKPSRTVWIAAAVAAVVLVGAVITGVVLAGDDSDPVTGAGVDPSADTSSASTTDVPEAAPPPASGSELVAVPELAADPSVGTIAMASRTSGVRVDHLADVDEFGTGADARSAPEGGRLVAFHLTGWSCDVDQCQNWSSLNLRVVVDGDSRRLPDTSGSYVVAVPAGATAADLVMKADGVKQSLSLLTGQPGPGNLAVLARGNRTTKIDETFTLTETNSEAVVYPDGVRRTEAERHVSVRKARLSYFVGSLEAASAERGYLAFDVSFTFPFIPDTRYGFTSDEIEFRGDDGKTYELVPLPEKVEGATAVFDVPADTTGGTLVIGGTHVVYPGTAQEYTATLSTKDVEVHFP